MNQLYINVGRQMSQFERQELSHLFETTSDEEFKAFQNISEQELQEAGVIEPIFDRVSFDPIKDESYFEDTDAKKIVEFAVMKLIFENGLLRSDIKENTASFYMKEYAGRAFIV